MTSMAGLLCAAVLAATAERERLVVLEVTPGDEGTKRAARMVEEQLLTELGRAGRFEVTGQSELSAVLGIERQRQLLGCAESSCFAEIGGALGARWLVMGSLGRFGNKLRLDLKLIDGKQGKAAAREGKVLDSDDELFPAVTQFVNTLVEAVEPGATRPRPAAPWLLAGGGVVAAATGATLMVLGSRWGAELNGQRASYTASEAQSKMSAFQATYFGGVALAALGAVAVGFGLWHGLSPDGPVATVAPVSAAVTPSGFEVRW